MILETAKKQNPTLKEVRFNEYLLLCEGTEIRYAFLLEYLHRSEYIGCQHLCQSWLKEVQTEFDRFKSSKHCEQLSLI